MGLETDGGGPFTMNLTIVHNQCLRWHEVVLVDYMLEDRRAWFSIVQVTAKKDLIETIIQDIKSRTLFHVFLEICCVGFIAVAQQEDFISIFQALKQFYMSMRKVDNDSVPRIEDLGVG